MVPDPREHKAPTLRHSVSKFFESIDIKIFADALMAKRASGCIAFAPGTGGDRQTVNRATDKCRRIPASFNQRLSKLAHQSASS
jgi:hypothetical protein